MKTMKRPAYNALQHLIIAERVCNYVGQIMTKGAPNKPLDIAHSLMRYESQMREFILNYDKLPDHLRPRALESRPEPDLNYDMLTLQRSEYRRWSKDPLLQVLACALLTEQSGIGNCGEQACVGFKYLCNRTNCKVFTLVEVGPDHVFLVLGVGKDKLKGVYPLNKAPDWPESAVICDPWYNEWFIVKKHWCLKMRSILKLTKQERTTGVVCFNDPIQGPEPPVNIE